MKFDFFSNEEFFEGANAVSLDPNVLISNFNKKFKKEKIEWVYDKLNQRISLRTKKNAYLLQIPRFYAYGGSRPHLL